MKRTTRGQGVRAKVTPPVCDLSRMLLDHLREIGGFNESIATVDHAVETLFKPEAEAFYSLMGRDHIYPSATVAFGAEFVARAFDVVVYNPPRAARTALLKLLDELRSDMRERVTFALATT